MIRKREGLREAAHMKLLGETAINEVKDMFYICTYNKLVFNLLNSFHGRTKF